MYSMRAECVLVCELGLGLSLDLTFLLLPEDGTNPFPTEQFVQFRSEDVLGIDMQWQVFTVQSNNFHSDLHN